MYVLADLDEIRRPRHHLRKMLWYLDKALHDDARIEMLQKYETKKGKPGVVQTDVGWD